MPLAHLADPTAIAPFSPEGALQVVIETPKASRNKYAFDHERRILVLKKTLPVGMLFPYDFGLVPSTLADDGDPIDVLVLMDEPAVPGCVVECRLIGVIMGEDHLPEGKRQRNDRLLAVADASHEFDSVRHIHDLPQSMLDHMAEFFTTYPRLLGGKTYKVLGIEGPQQARQLLEAAQRNAEQTAA